MQKQDKQFADKKSHAKSILESENDIISVLIEDHRPLRDLIQIMKDQDETLAMRKEAFEEFSPLLLTHANAEEKSLYEFMKTKPDLKEFAFEGVTEHGLADQMAEETGALDWRR